MALLVLACFVSLVRIERDRALQCWTTAWAALLCTTLLSAGLGNPLATSEADASHVLIFAMLACATSLPFFLLAGAYAWVQRPIPRRLPWIGLAASLAHGVLGVAGTALLAELLIVPVEVAAVLLAARLLWRGRLRHERPLMSVLLAGMHGVWAGVEATMGFVYGLRLPTQDAYAVAGSLVLCLGVLQIAAVLSRIRDGERRAVRVRERDLALLRSVARMGTSHDECAGLAQAVLPLVLGGLEVDCAGIWLFDAERRTLHCLAHLGVPDSVMSRFGTVGADAPIHDTLLDSRDPVVAGQGPESLRRVHPLCAEAGIRATAMLPLYWQDELLGMLALSSLRRECFEEADLALFPALADELALALHHVIYLQERVEALRDLARERLTLNAVLETAPIGILVYDADHRIQLMNHTGAVHIACGPPERWIGRHIEELVADLLLRIRDPEIIRDQAVRISREGRPLQDLEIVFSGAEDRALLLFSSHVYSTDGQLLGRVWSSRDVTEERRLGQQLRHSQKLETLGTLSGGIAHDFNNQLAVILGNARHLQRELESVQGLTGGGQPADDLQESLCDLERAAEHCAQLTRSLLTFARRAPPTIQSLETARVMSGLRELLRPLIPSTIAIEIVLEPDLPAIAADPVQLQQVLVNLAVNARDAMKERGAITLAARGCQVGPERARSVVGGRPGAFAELSVSDTGEGIDPECFGRIFEPFYTTKAVGEGTGLGLAIVHGVVTAHRGWVEVESRPGQGTTFRVLLPVSEGSPSRRSAAGSRGDANGTETVLVADDEPGIRRLVRRGLESRGYTVIEAFDGDDALLRWSSHREQIDALVLDLTMPGRDGLSVRRAILAEAPGLPILMTSGNVLERPAEGIDFLAKPFQLTELAARLREVIDGGPGIVD